MSRFTLAGAASLLLAPILAVVAFAAAPTVSDDAGDQLAALTDHRAAAIASLTLQTVAIVLLLAGTIWLAVAVAGRSPRLAFWGGVVGALGSALVLFEDGIAAAGPAVAATLDPATATSTLHAIGSSTAVSALEPLTVVGDLGLVALAVAAVRMGVPRWAAALFAIGAFGETIGFATSTRALIVAGFAVLFVGLAGTVRTLVRRPVERTVATPATA